MSLSRCLGRNQPQAPSKHNNNNPSGDADKRARRTPGREAKVGVDGRTVLATNLVLKGIGGAKLRCACVMATDT